MLFCYFAEDTNIFTVNQFADSLASHTKSDWSDTDLYLENLFNIFNIKNRNDSVVQYLKDFPYVNWKLFEDEYSIPKFTTKSRKLLIELWKLDWSGINPDIFGSMMQAVMDTEERWNSWKINRRTLLIFENWIQSNMLLRSLWKRLKANWKVVTELLGNQDNYFTNITEEDNESWYIKIIK